jgi:nitrate/TMAO reductase-like tetraheme cytochrome c subunit
VALVCLLVLVWVGQALWADEPKPEEKTEKPKNEYVGDDAKKCAMCHKAQVEAWQKWPMAHAWDKLSAEEQKKDECIKCHVTGYGQPGGFVSLEKTPTLVGIQCEACHGPAGEHMKVPLTDKEQRKATMLKPNEDSCKVCHTKEGNPHFKEFKFADAVKTLADHLPKPSS